MTAAIPTGLSAMIEAGVSDCRWRRMTDFYAALWRVGVRDPDVWSAAVLLRERLSEEGAR